MLKFKDFDFGIVIMLAMLGVILYMYAYAKGKDDGFEKGLSKQELKKVYDKKLKELNLRYDYIVYSEKSESYSEGYSDCLNFKETGLKKFKLMEDDLSFEKFSDIWTNDAAMTKYFSDRSKKAVEHYNSNEDCSKVRRSWRERYSK